MRLINADELINIIAKQIRCDRHEIICGLLQAFIEQVEAMPTVDAEPVRHGKWMEIVTHNGCTPDYDCVCSLCGSSGAPIDDYCRGCGAKMDGE